MELFVFSCQIKSQKVGYFFFFSVVGIMRLEFKNIPRIHNICSLSGLLMLISKVEVQQWTKKLKIPAILKLPRESFVLLIPCNFRSLVVGLMFFRHGLCLTKNQSRGFLKILWVCGLLGWGFFFKLFSGLFWLVLIPFNKLGLCWDSHFCV